MKVIKTRQVRKEIPGCKKEETFIVILRRKLAPLAGEETKVFAKNNRVTLEIENFCCLSKVPQVLLKIL